MIRKFLCNECGIECKLEISTDGVPSTPRACSYPGECAKKSVWKEVQQSVVVYDGGEFTIPGWKYPIVVNLNHLAIKKEVPLYCGSMIVGKYHAKIENGELRLTGDFEPRVADGLFSMCVDNTETSLCRESFSINGQDFVPTDEEPIYYVSCSELLNVSVVCHVNVKKVEEEKPLSDWCKVGEWAYWKGAPDIGYEPSYMRITSVGNGIVDCDTIQGIPFEQGQLKQARVRPWTFEEAPVYVKARSKDDEKMVVLYLNTEQEPFISIGACNVDSFETVLELYKQLDGSPCGVLEHLNDNGEWVE